MSVIVIGRHQQESRSVSLCCDRSLDAILQQNRHICYGEKSLLGAILRQSICDLFGFHLPPLESENEGNLYRTQAREWFLSNAEDEFSFIWLCRHLGLNYGQLRSRLYRLFWHQKAPSQALHKFQLILGEKSFRLSRKRAQGMESLRFRKKSSAEKSLRKYLSGQECSTSEPSDSYGSIADIAYAV